MNINIQLKTLALLCALPASNIVASAPASQPDIPASLQAELKRIDDLPDYKVLTAVVPCSIDRAEQLLRKSEGGLMVSRHSLAIASAKYDRSALKYWTIEKELTLCPNGVLKQTLRSKLNEAKNQWEANVKEELRCANCIIKDQPVVAYNFMLNRYDALAAQASILLAQKETEKAQLQQEKAQSQQREQVLQAALNGYQLLEDGLQIEGVPNVPGGVKPKLKRSGSF